MKRSISILTVAYVLGLLGFIGYGYFLQSDDSAEVIQATVEAPEIRISAKIPGRVDEIFVTEGQQVAAGDAIFSLTSPELDAKREQALALIEAKNALRDRAERGARTEEIQMAKDNAARARTNAELAQKSLTRVQNLFNDGLVSAQKLDEAQATETSAVFAQQAAEQRYQMAMNGTEDELKNAAESDLRAAQGVLAEVDAAMAETQIASSYAGEVSQVLIHEGEVSPAGFPVVTLTDMSQAYVRFHVTEDKLTQFEKGTEFTAYFPGLKDEQVLEVFYVSVLGDYATWRASTPGDYDLRTFEVRAYPITKNAAWRAGMSAVITMVPEA
jgi:HlyD family secretion protein